MRTSQGRYSAARLIIAGGGWSSRLLAELGLPLELRKILSAGFPRRKNIRQSEARPDSCSISTRISTMVSPASTKKA